MPDNQTGGMPTVQSQGQAGQSAQGGATGGQNGQAGTAGAQSQPVAFDEWIQEQEAAVQTAYNEHVKGLRNTVQATRQERDGLSQQLAQLQAALGKNPEEAKRLIEQMTHDLETANRRAAFVEEAVRAEIGCTNPKAAYAMALTDNLFDRRGNPDWTAIKSAAPELFGGRSGIPAGNAGAGTGQAPQAGGMNEYIRRAAGRS